MLQVLCHLGDFDVITLVSLLFGALIHFFINSSEYTTFTSVSYEVD